MFSQLMDKVGFPWAIRICAFLILAMLIVSNLTIRSRVPPNPTKLGIQTYTKHFVDIPYLLVIIASFLYYLAMFLPINYIQLQATSYGMSSHLASYLIPILNAARFVILFIPQCSLLDCLALVNRWQSVWESPAWLGQ